MYIVSEERLQYATYIYIYTERERETVRWTVRETERLRLFQLGMQCFGRFDFIDTFHIFCVVQGGATLPQLSNLQ